MTTVLQFDIQTTEQQHKLQQVIEFVSNLKLPFRKVEPAEPSPLDDTSIVWEFPEPDEDWQKMGLSALLRDDDDWECPEEWIELSKQTAV